MKLNIISTLKLVPIVTKATNDDKNAFDLPDTDALDLLDWQDENEDKQNEIFVLLENLKLSRRQNL